MNKHEKTIVLALDKPLSVTARPFRSAARKAGIGEGALLAGLRGLKRRGIIRRAGAVLNHRSVGLRENVLVAWKVGEEDLRETAARIVRFSNVSHCYARRSCPAWPYNLYTMIHGKDRKACLALVRKISGETSLKQKRLLFTVKEFKKSKTNLGRILE